MLEVLSLGVIRPCVRVSLSVAQHRVDDPGQLVGAAAAMALGAPCVSPGLLRFPRCAAVITGQGSHPQSSAWFCCQPSETARISKRPSHSLGLAFAPDSVNPTYLCHSRESETSTIPDQIPGSSVRNFAISALPSFHTSPCGKCSLQGCPDF